MQLFYIIETIILALTLVLSVSMVCETFKDVAKTKYRR